ncbi:MAG: hypothetical protein Kapaf2KO_09740 [Candidatus Kapaibacteriales bacterium]
MQRKNNFGFIIFRFSLYLGIILAVFYFRFGNGLILKNFDFQSFYMAGKAIEQGLNPYDTEELNSSELKIYVEKEVAESNVFKHQKQPFNHTYPYVYPPGLSIILSQFDFYLTRELWAIISLLLLAISGIILEQLFSTLLARWKATILSILVIVATPLLYTIYAGQIEAISFLIGLLILNSIIKNTNYSSGSKNKINTDLLSGLLAGVFLFLKPHLFFWLFLIPLGNRKFIYSFIISAILSNLIFFLYSPESFFQFLEFITKGANVKGLTPITNELNGSLTALIALLFENNSKLIALIIDFSYLLLSAFFIYGINTQIGLKKTLPLICLVLSVSFMLFTPYFWMQHIIYLVFPIIVIVLFYQGEESRKSYDYYILVSTLLCSLAIQLLSNNIPHISLLNIPLLIFSSIFMLLTVKRIT